VSEIPPSVLALLKKGARTADQIATELGVAVSTLRKVLPKMELKGLIRATRSATGNRYGAPPRIYWLAREPMIQLGKAHRADVYQAGRRIGELLLEHGEVAVFVDDRWNIGVALHHEGNYQDLLAKHGAWLVGRYRRKEGEQIRTSFIAEDMLVRLEQIDAARLARAHA